MIDPVTSFEADLEASAEAFAVVLQVSSKTRHIIASSLVCWQVQFATVFLVPRLPRSCTMRMLLQV
jgi:hypothetical protein